MNPILNLLSGPSGKPSTMRGVTWFVAIVVVGTWSWVSMSKLELQPISSEQLALVLGPIAAKAWQRGKESDKRDGQ